MSQNMKRIFAALLLSVLTTSLALAASLGVDVRAFGAKCDGVTNDYAAVIAGSAAAVKKGVPLEFPAQCAVGQTIALDTTFNGLKWEGTGKGGGGLKKGFNGTLVTVAGTQNFEMRRMHFDGQHGTYNGKGFVFSGTSNYPRISESVLVGFTDTYIEFGADAGYDFKFTGSACLLVAGQVTVRCVHTNGPDTAANHRHFVDCSMDGYLDLSGALASEVVGCRFTTIETTNGTSVLRIVGNTWAASSAITINSAVTTVVGNRIAAAVTLGAGSSGTFVANHPTLGSLTNSAGSNWLVLHRIGGAKSYLVGRSLLSADDTVPQWIQSVRSSYPGDANATYTYGAANGFIYQSPLTAARTVTLDVSADVPQGARVRVVRQGGATGAFNLNVAAYALTAAKQWIEVEYDGAGTWTIVGGGVYTF